MFEDRGVYNVLELIQRKDNPPEAIIEPDLLYPQSILVLGADPGRARSTLITQMAFELALGHPWLGRFDTRRSKVLFLNVRHDPLPMQDWAVVHQDADLRYGDRVPFRMDGRTFVKKSRAFIAKLTPDVLIINDFNATIPAHWSDRRVRQSLRDYRRMIFDLQCGLILIVGLEFDFRRGSQGYPYDVDLVSSFKAVYDFAETLAYFVPIRKKGRWRLHFVRHSFSSGHGFYGKPLDVTPEEGELTRFRVARPGNRGRD